MNIFLTSQASYVLEKIALLLPRKASEYNVIFIPTAAKPYLLSPWMEKDRRELVRLGFAVTNLELDTATAEEVSAAVHAADIIFVGGGNTFYLLEEVKRTGFDTAVKEAMAEGKIYIGSSAGSVLAAPDISYVELFDDRKKAVLSDMRGIGLVNFSILPHIGNPNYSKLHTRVLNDYRDSSYQLVPLRDDQFAIPEAGGWKVIG